MIFFTSGNGSNLVLPIKTGAVPPRLAFHIPITQSWEGEGGLAYPLSTRRNPQRTCWSRCSEPLDGKSGQQSCSKSQIVGLWFFLEGGSREDGGNALGCERAPLV